MCLLPSNVPPFLDPRRSVTRARRLYVSSYFRRATSRLKHAPRPKPEGAHDMCLRPSKRPPVPRPRTQCHTSATSLRKQLSKLPFKRPQTRGSAQDVHCRQCAMDGAFGTIVSGGDYRRRRVLQNNTYRRRMNPAPQRQELERLVCFAS
ncbi:hypothetical protein SAMN05443529_10163 [Desulfosporosinus hippei DSM 8344]|uniref:Uncharacterized protein n=1 Tax=Desulfosporosinus hippei DSM 8344 TaxID=1121419 RepID=A0A1G7RGU3_9FIRM|nr:hypothetical protein SAMN05443529_10163 [Desulfosporosinus hippei DSM 8344]